MLPTDEETLMVHFLLEARRLRINVHRTYKEGPSVTFKLKDTFLTFLFVYDTGQSKRLDPGQYDGVLCWKNTNPKLHPITANLNHKNWFETLGDNIPTVTLELTPLEYAEYAIYHRNIIITPINELLIPGATLILTCPGIEDYPQKIYTRVLDVFNSPHLGLVEGYSVASFSVFMEEYE